MAASGMIACDVRSPSTPRSSSRATATASRSGPTAASASLTFPPFAKPPSPRCRLLCGEGYEPPVRGSAEHEPAEKLGRGIREVEAGVRATRLGACSCGIDERGADRDQVADFGIGRAGHGRELRRGALEAGGVTEHARLMGHEPLELLAGDGRVALAGHRR